MIELHNVEKTYHSKSGDIDALHKTNLTINAGEIFGVIGLSGAGKSTLIRCINMLEVPTGGQVVVDGQDLTAMSEAELRKARQNIGMIFQHFNLLASRTVYNNIAFPLEIQGLSKDEIRKKVEPLLELVGLVERRDHYPSQLSGGQKQRVGIARAFATQPELLLMDEPFGALDALTRGVIQDELVNIVEETHQTVFMITHDIDEAILLADRIFLMSNGPRAFLAEIVENTIPKPRHRDNIHHHEHYYKIRNHLLDFLVHRSKALQQSAERPTTPKVINFDNEAWSI